MGKVKAAVKSAAKPTSKNILSTRGKTRKFFHLAKEIRPCLVMDAASEKFRRFMGAIYVDSGAVVMASDNVVSKWGDIPKTVE